MAFIKNREIYTNIFMQKEREKLDIYIIRKVENYFTNISQVCPYS